MAAMLIMLGTLATASVGQESPQQPAPAAPGSAPPPAAPAPAAKPPAEAPKGAVKDDEFIPTQEVQADEEVTFPVDI
jgi:hypothetical protein